MSSHLLPPLLLLGALALAAHASHYEAYGQLRCKNGSPNYQTARLLIRRSRWIKDEDYGTDYVQPFNDGDFHVTGDGPDGYWVHIHILHTCNGDEQKYNVYALQADQLTNVGLIELDGQKYWPDDDGN